MTRSPKATGFALLSLLVLTLPAAAQTDVSGTWKIDVQSPQGPAQITAVLTQNGTEVTGALQLDMAEGVEMTDAVMEGNKLKFMLHVSIEAQWISIEGTADITGDTMTGSFYLAEFGTIPFTGKRGEG